MPCYFLVRLSFFKFNDNKEGIILKMHYEGKTKFSLYYTI